MRVAVGGGGIKASIIVMIDVIRSAAESEPGLELGLGLGLGLEWEWVQRSFALSRNHRCETALWLADTFSF